MSEFLLTLFLIASIVYVGLTAEAEVNALARHQGCQIEARGFLRGYECMDVQP